MPASPGCVMAISSNMRGALFMSLSMAGFTFNDSIVKLLTSDMNVAQVIFLRGAVASVLIYLLARQRRALRPLRILLDRWVAIRVVGELGGTLTFLIGLSHIPLANASAILQALPLAVTMGAALFLSEPVLPRGKSILPFRHCSCRRSRHQRSRSGASFCFGRWVAGARSAPPTWV
jgi:drug/metabolite transporter (DMT)-like permease